MRAASRPELVPSEFLPKKDEDVPPETRNSVRKVERMAEVVEGYLLFALSMTAFLVA